MLPADRRPRRTPRHCRGAGRGTVWILQVYPALTRRRALARRLHVLAATDATDVVAQGDAAVAAGLLDAVTDQLTVVDVDLTQYAETYYFRESDPALSLAANLGYVAELTAAGGRSSADEVRHAARRLELSLRHLLGHLGEGYLDRPGADGGVLEAFARDHQHPPPGSAGDSPHLD